MANLYPSKHLSKIIKVLDSMKCSGANFELDLQMSALLKENGLKSAWIQDQFFNHLGFRSSLHKQKDKFKKSVLLDSFHLYRHGVITGC